MPDRTLPRLAVVRAGRDAEARDERPDADRVRRMLIESARQQRDRDSVSCSLRFLWRQHVEARLRQVLALGTFLLHGGVESEPPSSLEELWPRARVFLLDAGGRASPELEAAEQALRNLREPASPAEAAAAGLPESITALVRFLETAVETLYREAQRKIAARRA